MPMDDSPEALQIVESMIGLGKAYSMEITADGVETGRQLEQLRHLACDVVQGYYIGKPVVPELLKTWWLTCMIRRQYEFCGRGMFL